MEAIGGGSWKQPAADPILNDNNARSGDPRETPEGDRRESDPPRTFNEIGCRSDLALHWEGGGGRRDE